MKPNSQVLILLLVSFSKHLFSTCYVGGTVGVLQGGGDKPDTNPALRKLQSNGGHRYNNWR